MPAAVERVLRAFDLKHPPMSDDETEQVRKEANDFALHLLQNYRDQLAQRTVKPHS